MLYGYPSLSLPRSGLVQRWASSAGNSQSEGRAEAVSRHLHADVRWESPALYRPRAVGPLGSATAAGAQAANQEAMLDTDPREVASRSPSDHWIPPAWGKTYGVIERTRQHPMWSFRGRQPAAEPLIDAPLEARGLGPPSNTT